MASKWQGEPKQWRVRGKSTDGLVVTLGCHDTKEAARADADKFLTDAFYRDVTIERIIHAEESAPQDT